MRFVLRFAAEYLGRHKGLFFALMIMLLIDLMFVTFAPLSVKFLIDYAIIPKNASFLYMLLGILTAGAAASFAAGIAGDWLLSKLGSKVHRDLRVRLFTRLQFLPIGYYQRVRTGDVLSRFTVDAIEVTGLITGTVPYAFRTLVSLAASLGIMIYLNWTMTLIVLAGAVILFVLPALLGKRAEKANLAYKRELDQGSSMIQENVKGQTVVKGFNLEASVIDRFKEHAARLMALQFRGKFLQQSMMRVPAICMVLLTLAIVGLGAYLSFHEYISVGTFMSFNVTFLNMSGYLLSITGLLPALVTASASIRRIDEILRHPLPPSPEPGPGPADQQEGLKPIRFEDVSFRYTDDKAVLKNVNLTIPPGTFAAFVGPSGSGKSSMIQLLLRFYEPQQGKIAYGDREIGTLPAKMLRQTMAAVFQDNFLFHGTIRDNLLIANPRATEEEIIAAAKQAEIHDFIMSLPEGYDTLIADEGKNLSGGQRQRIAIARAILRNPQILVLDEATSALDPVTENAINQTIMSLAKGRTVISVTHRLASVTHANAIFVFKDGELIEQGNHGQLLAQGGFYREMWEKQSGMTVSEDGLMAEINEERIRRLPLFRNIGIEAIREIKPFFVTEWYNEGHTVIREGDYGDKFYLIVRGEVEVGKTTEDGAVKRVAVLQDGDHFGEIALLKNVPRTATVTTLTPTIFLSLQRPLLELVMQKHPDIRKVLLDTLQERE